MKCKATVGVVLNLLLADPPSVKPGITTHPARCTIQAALWRRAVSFRVHIARAAARIRAAPRPGRPLRGQRGRLRERRPAEGGALQRQRRRLRQSARRQRWRLRRVSVEGRRDDRRRDVHSDRRLLRAVTPRLRRRGARADGARSSAPGLWVAPSSSGSTATRRCRSPRPREARRRAPAGRARREP